MSPAQESPAAEQTTVLLRALLVGVVGGAVAVLFRYAATALPRLVWPAAPDLVLAVGRADVLRRLAIPTVGALLAGLVLSAGRRWSGAVRGWDILEAIVLRNGILPLKPTLVKCASSLLTVASAGAVGREGPIVLLSGSVASALGQRFGASTRHLRVLLGCGAAAGLACAYNAPLGAALFTMEILFGSFALEVFVPLVFAAVIATVMTWAAFGAAPLLPVPAVAMSSVWEMLAYAVLGLLGGVAGAAFLQALRASALLFKRLTWPRPLAMASSGAVLGLVVLGYPELVGNGREAILALFQQHWGLERVLALLALRYVVTPLMVGSGTVGGVFTPTLFLGAMLGQAFGSLMQALFPALGVAPGAYALVGMGCLLAGTTHAPMTSVLMVFEMTLDYDVVLPLLLGSAASSLVATRLSVDSVYTEALRRKSEVLEGGQGAVIDALHVGDVMRQEQVCVPAELPLPQVLDALLAARRNHVYVVDAEGRFEGSVNLHDVNRELRSGAQPEKVAARDVMRARFETTVPEESLVRVLERFEAQDCERLPVLADRASRRLLGTISKRDILAVYSLDLVQRAAAAPRLPTALEPSLDGLMAEIALPADLPGRRFDETHFRERYGLSVLMVRRPGTGLVIPDGHTRFLDGDRLIVFGPRERLAELRQTVGPPAAQAEE